VSQAEPTQIADDHCKTTHYNPDLQVFGIWTGQHTQNILEITDLQSLVGFNILTQPKTIYSSIKSFAYGSYGSSSLKPEL
jgi:hypothetical protein